MKYRAAALLLLIACSSVSADDIPVPPAKRLNLDSWKLTLPIASTKPRRPKEISQPELASFQLPKLFYVSSKTGAVVFRANCDGVTTKNSGYPRCELREMKAGGRAEVGWSTDDPSLHVMTAQVAITHLPDRKPHVVALQIHDADDDLMMLRLERRKLFIERNGLPEVILNRDYQLGDPIDIIIRAGNGRIVVVHDGHEAMDWAVSRSGCYFKAGCYTQSNLARRELPAAYGEVQIRELILSSVAPDTK